jgi:succinyl-CoA synthetase alpha subunit
MKPGPAKIGAIEAAVADEAALAATEAEAEAVVAVMEAVAVADMIAILVGRQLVNREW